MYRGSHRAATGCRDSVRSLNEGDHFTMNSSAAHRVVAGQSCSQIRESGMTQLSMPFMYRISGSPQMGNFTMVGTICPPATTKELYAGVKGPCTAPQGGRVGRHLEDLPSALGVTEEDIVRPPGSPAQGDPRLEIQLRPGERVQRVDAELVVIQIEGGTVTRKGEILGGVRLQGREVVHPELEEQHAPGCPCPPMPSQAFSVMAPASVLSGR